MNEKGSDEELVRALKASGWEEVSPGVFEKEWGAWDVDSSYKYGSFDKAFRKGAPVKITEYLWLYYRIALNKRSACWKLYTTRWDKKHRRCRRADFESVVEAVLNGSLFREAKPMPFEFVKRIGGFEVGYLEDDYSNAVISVPRGTLAIAGEEFNDEAYRYKTFWLFAPALSPEDIKGECDIYALLARATCAKS